jgi:hypothetical protein
VVALVEGLVNLLVLMLEQVQVQLIKDLVEELLAHHHLELLLVVVVVLEKLEIPIEVVMVVMV